MAFVDSATIEITSGKGGDGIIAFRREPFTPMGGPYGGDGGRGGDVIFVADEGLRTLMDFRYNRHFKAKNGQNGGTKGMTGASAENRYVKVPTGTTVIDDETGMIMADMTKHGEEFTVARGGRGGRGNMKFATPANPAPEVSENGEPGQVLKIRLELKVLADVGLVGYPSAGKSTFLSVVTAAKPKIAAYHFTTIDPNLGMVRLEDDRSFAIADLPGLIEGASEGVGLGLRFLKHVSRTKVILHFVDMSQDSGIDVPPFQAFLNIRNEMESYDPTILDKPTIVVATKMDLPESSDNLVEFKKELQENGFTDFEVAEISSATNKGVRELLLKTADMIDNAPDAEEVVVEGGEVLYKFEDDNDRTKFTIEADPESPDGWLIVGGPIEKLWKMTNKNSQEAVLRFGRQLRSFGIEEALREAGAQDGDEVRINNSDFIFEFDD
ncbi:MAG: GTPase ObgE [Lactobacillaceae bacterium]|jgi:GTP-binding protein|nr:GTPase ObgE [Lactobacillaceae bacterium]